MARDTIFVRGLRVDCVVGILPDEREREQPLIVDLELGLDTSRAAYSGKIGATCDYSRVADEVSTLLRFRRYKLLEMAAEELAAMLFGVHDPLEDVRVELSKPEAMADRARRVGVVIERRRADFGRAREKAEFGEVEILHQSREAGLYLLHIDPGSEIPAHYHRIMRELEWLVTGALERDGVRLQDFAPVVWDRERVHHYTNVGSRRATLFCCDSPPFVPTDEIMV